MTGGTAREKRTFDKRKQLLDAAERIYYRQGDLGLTVRRIAAEAETTSQTIYTYFGSRDAVLEAMHARALSGLDSLLASLAGTTLRSGQSGPSPIAARAGLYRRYALTNPAHFSMVVTGKGPEGTDQIEVAQRRERLLQLLAAGERPTEAMATEPTGDAAVTLAVVNGFIDAELHDLIEETDHPDKLFADLVETIAKR